MRKFPRVQKNRITQLFGCDYPLVLPGMSWISTPLLVAAVSEAGGLGILATGPLNPEETRKSIHEIRRLTDKPFGIGATLLMPGAKENAQVALEEQVPVINISLGKADWIARAAHQYGGKVLATVTNAKHGKAAIESGADALMATGFEAAAHGGPIGSISLIPAISQKFPDTPIVAAGGIADGRGLAAALSLGADAVAMGSRFAASRESSLAESAKDAIVMGTESDTVYGANFDGIPARVLRTETSVRLMETKPWFPTILYRSFAAAQKMNIPLWKVIPGLLAQWDKMYMIAQFGAATQAITNATVHGDLKHGVQFIGQSQGCIHEILSVEDIVQRTMYEAQNSANQTNHMLINNGHLEPEHESSPAV